MLAFLTIFLATYALALPVEQSLVFNQDGSYKFNYDTGTQEGRHSRQEVRNVDGSVEGSYSYQDPDGNTRVVNYRAGKQGFVASGDVGVPGAPKTQVPLLVPDVKEEPETDSKDKQPQIDDNSSTVKPTSDEPIGDDKSDVTTKSPVDDSGRKRETPMFYGGQDFFNSLPISTPFGRRRLDRGDLIDESLNDKDEQAPLSNADTPIDEQVQENPVKENPIKETPAKPGSGQPLSFIYTIGSPYIPSLLHAPPSQSGEMPAQHQVVDGKGAAKYFIYVPSHHYIGSPSYFYLPQAELKPQTQDESAQNNPGIQHNSSPLVPVISSAHAPAVPLQPTLNAIRYQPNSPVQPQIFPLSYQTSIRHHRPIVGAPQESAVGYNEWSYNPVGTKPVPVAQPQPGAQGTVQAGRPDLVLTYIHPDASRYVPASDPQDKTHSEVKGAVSDKQDRPDLVPTYIQPDSSKFVPASKPEISSAQDNSVPVSGQVGSVDQPSLRRSVYHHYVYKGPDASYGYHYQY